MTDVPIDDAEERSDGRLVRGDAVEVAHGLQALAKLGYCVRSGCKQAGPFRPSLIETTVPKLLDHEAGDQKRQYYQAKNCQPIIRPHLVASVGGLFLCTCLSFTGPPC